MHALITGASKGIGRSTVHQLIQRNIPVVAVATSVKEQAALQQMAQNWDILELFDADLSTDQGVNDVVTFMQDKPISHIFHNAGVVDTSDFSALSQEEFRKVMRLNVEVPLFMSRALSPMLVPHSRILLMNSGLSKFYLKGMTSYCISRSAGHMVQQVLSSELAPVLVGSVIPGNVDTETLRYCVERLGIEDHFKYDKCWMPDQIGRFIKYILLDASDADFCTLWDAKDAFHFPYWINPDEISPSRQAN
mmetsp:Transcript_22730/g.40887  ORF Transcript_22730/g.40887 Transcript_22730/m.40887 type:complete len:249 (-) Transcript_22730:1-747(-)